MGFNSWFKGLTGLPLILVHRYKDRMLFIYIYHTTRKTHRACVSNRVTYLQALCRPM